MTVYSIPKQEILLFKIFASEKGGSPLRHFINFLNSMGIKYPLNFSYVEKDWAFINNLSLKENILLESVPFVLSSTKNFQLETYLKKNKNRHITELFNSAGDIDCRPKSSSSQTRKIVNLVTNLLKKSDYLFLDCPEKHLSDEHLKLLISALHFRIENSEQTIFISSPDEEMWCHHISGIITKSTRQKFIISPIIRKELEKDIITDDGVKDENKTVNPHVQLVDFRIDKKNVA